MTEGNIEVWELRHPTRGVFTAAVGPTASLDHVDPAYPTEKAGQHVRGMVLFRDGEPIARTTRLDGVHCDPTADPLDDDAKVNGTIHHYTHPRVEVITATLDAGTVRHIRFREGNDLAEFTPPPGSAAEQWQAKVAASPWRRTVYPILGGMGKAAWAILAVVLIPMLLRLIEPLIPSFDLGLSLPSFDLPLPSFDLSWPQISLPDWMDPVFEYAKIWVPLVIGVLAAVFASRRARRIRQTHEAWARGDDSMCDDSACDAPAHNPSASPSPQQRDQP